MSDDWQVGDLAIKKRGRCDIVPRGSIWRVVGFNNHETGLGLILEGWPYPGGFYAQNFDKVRPDIEPCEEEFVTLLKRMKPAKVQA